MRMTHFLLTLDDAIDLVMFAAQNASGGETYVKRCSQHLYPMHWRNAMQRGGTAAKLYGDWLFPGEKSDEILLTEEELPRAVDMGEYISIHPWWINAYFRTLPESIVQGIV